MEDWTLGETFASTAGEVRWARLGRPGGEPVVLLHGTPWSSFVWRGVARALAAQGRYEVYVWDMPGYGRSQKYAGQDVSLAAQGAGPAGRPRARLRRRRRAARASTCPC